VARGRGHRDDAPDRRGARVGHGAPARGSGGRDRQPRAGRGARRDPAARRWAPLGHRERDRTREPALARPRGLRRAGLTTPPDGARPQAGHRRHGLCAAAPAPGSPRGVARRGDGRRGRGRGDGDRRRPRALRAAGQQVRATARELPRVRLACTVGLPDRRPLRPMRRGAHAGRRGGGLDLLLSDHERRRREAGRPWRAPHPDRSRRPRAGVRVRGTDRRRGVPDDRDDARADAAAGAAPGRLRAALRRRGARVARVPGRHPARPHGDVATGPSVRTPGWRPASSKPAWEAGPPGPRSGRGTPSPTT
jgi:hypothetical protein